MSETQESAKSQDELTPADLKIILCGDSAVGMASRVSRDDEHCHPVLVRHEIIPLFFHSQKIIPLGTEIIPPYFFIAINYPAGAEGCSTADEGAAQSCGSAVCFIVA